MEYRASVRSAGPIFRTTEWTTTNLQKAKDWAENQKSGVDDIVEVVGVSRISSMELIRKVWRLVDGRWIDTEQDSS